MDALQNLHNTVEVLTKDLSGNLLLTFAKHRGLRDFMSRTVDAMKVDIESMIFATDEASAEIVANGPSEAILNDLRAVLNDSKNKLILNRITPEIISFYNNYLLLISNWASIYPDNKGVLEIRVDIEACSKLLTMYNSLDEMFTKTIMAMDALTKISERAGNNPTAYLTSVTYLNAIKDSLNRDK